MAVFSCRDYVTVGIGDEIELPDIRMRPGSKYRVECNWIKNGKKEGDHWEINNDNLEGVYMTWRKEHWEQLFDPFKVKILRLTINRIE